MFSLIDPTDPNRMFIGERGLPANNGDATATIRVLNLTTKTVSGTPFLTIEHLDNRSEGGLVGMALHPDYETNGKFYLYVTAPDSLPDTDFSAYIRQYTVSANPVIANPTATPIHTWGRPQRNHVGGWIGFSPIDGYLYIMSGDGGNGNDQGPGHVEPNGNAQTLENNLLGKALRIDVDGDDFADPLRNYRIPDSNPYADIRDQDRAVVTVVPNDDEIWSYGLRNPFRAGFDRATGDFWIGDVGQDRREEVNFQPANSPGGLDYGWRRREGFIQTPTVGGGINGAVQPLWDYKQSDAPDVTAADANFLGQSVVGGVPYRGPDPTLQGLYFFADAITSRVWTLRRATASSPQVVTYVTPQLPFDVGSATTPVSITEDAVGNLYITYLSGSVYRIKTNVLTPGDFNADAKVDAADLALWRIGFGKTTGVVASDGDANGDGRVDGADFLAWQRNLGWSALNVPGGSSSPVPEASGVAMLACGIMSLVRRGARQRARAA